MKKYLISAALIPTVLLGGCLSSGEYTSYDEANSSRPDSSISSNSPSAASPSSTSPPSTSPSASDTSASSPTELTESDVDACYETISVSLQSMYDFGTGFEAVQTLTDPELPQALRQLGSIAAKTARSFDVSHQCMATIASALPSGSVEQQDHVIVAEVNQDATRVFSEWDQSLGALSAAIAQEDSSTTESILNGAVTQLVADTTLLNETFSELASQTDSSRVEESYEAPFSEKDAATLEFEIEMSEMNLRLNQLIIDKMN